MNKGRWILVGMAAALLALTFGGCSNPTAPVPNPPPVDGSGPDLTNYVIAPVKGATPDATAIDTPQYAGSIKWQDDDENAPDGNFAADTAYKAVLTLTAKDGFSFDDLTAKDFSHAGAEFVTIKEKTSGTITVIIGFLPTEAVNEPGLMDLTDYVIAPVKGATPVSTDIDTPQYAGSIEWQDDDENAPDGNFAADTAYKAVLTLTAKDGFSFDGFTEKDFSYTGASVTMTPGTDGSTITVTITFPKTVAEDVNTPVDAPSLTKPVAAPVAGRTPVTTIEAAQYTGNVAWEDDSGYAPGGNFAASTVYKAVVTLTAKDGFTFTGVAEDAFVHSGAESITNAAGNGETITVTITFPKTVAEDVNTPVDALSLTKPVAAPVAGRTPVATIEAPQYTGDVAWEDDSGNAPGGNFAASTVYKAVVTLTAKDGFTFTGVAEDAFAHSGTKSVTNAAGNGKTITVTISFPATEAEPDAPPDPENPPDTEDPPDTTAPAGVTGITGTTSNGRVKLTWTNPTDADLDHIEIRWNGGSYNTTNVTITTHTVKDLTNGTPYTFTLKAVDKAGNETTVSTGPWTPGFSVSEVADYLNSVPNAGTAADPVPLSVPRNIAVDWDTLLNAIDTANKKVALDLSGYAMTGTEFDPGTAGTGEKNIVSLVLPDTATSIKAGTNNAPTFKNFTALKSVSGKNVRSVGECAFYGCTALTTVNLPAATTIGGAAFESCRGLTSVDLPKATTVGYGAFEGCTGLTTVNLPAATTIGGAAFESCRGLTTVDLPKATTIGYGAFRDCTGLTTVDLPSATSINGAFEGCTGLTTVDLPSATSIGERAFINCNNLTSVNLPKATTIGNGAFEGCTGLTTVNFPAATTIGNDAFIGCTNLTEVTLPSATTIDGRAFSGCTGLTTVNAPSATTIGNEAFYGYTGLTTVYLPKATTIGAYAFRNTGLTEITLPSATTIGRQAFQDCNNLTTVNLPSATTVGVGVFRGCTDLTSVNAPKARSIGDFAFEDCTGLTSVDLAAAESIDTGAFADCTGLTGVTLPEATSIGDHAFYGCTNLAEVTLPKATTIDGHAFSGCTGLTTVNAPKATTIGNEAFYGCTGLTRVNLPSATTIGGSAFQDCTGLTEVTLPSATTIGWGAFQDCTGLTTVNLDAAESIGLYAFQECTGLTAVYAPAATTIGNYAFVSCAGIRDLTITLGVAAPALGEGMFFNVGSRTVTVKVPTGATGYGPIPGSYTTDTTTPNWGNGFRGGGWDGNAFVGGGGFNADITLRIEEYP